jgi:hypothetical protein
MCVDKLMDGAVDNLMDNSASCPQVAAQAAHELFHDELFNYNNNFYILLFYGNGLERGVHFKSS